MGHPKVQGGGTDSRLQLLPAMRGKGVGRTVSEAYWAEDRHTPSASDSERVCRGSKDDREAGGVPCWERLLQKYSFTYLGFLTYIVGQRSLTLLHVDSG